MPPTLTLARTAPLLLLGLSVMTVAGPVCLAVARGFMAGQKGGSVDAGRGLSMIGAPSGLWTVVLTTVAVPLVIAISATTLAWPAAWLLRGLHDSRKRVFMLAMLLLALMMPQYLAYAGLGLARAPGTWLGELTNRLPSNLNVAFGQTIAIVGLVLWSWPVAILALLAPVRRMNEELLEQMDLSGAGWAAILSQKIAMLKQPLLLSVGLVWLLMVGSIVPLHLAQIPTLSIDLWARLALDPTSPAVWPAAMPLVLIAGIGAFVSSRTLTKTCPHDQRGQAPRRATARNWILPCLSLFAAVVLPLVVFSTTLQHSRLLTDFWLQQTKAVGTSLGVAVATGFILTLIACIAWIGCSSRMGRRVVAIALSVQLVGLLLPGVLLGGALGSMFSVLLPEESGRLWADSWVPLVFGHVARFGGVGMALGVWLAGSEAQSLRDARVLSGGDGVKGWWVLAARPQIGTLIGVGVAGICLSLHEIEVTVQLAPPGYECLAAVMLNHLHMNSVQELAAAGVNVLGGGIVIGLAGGLLLSGAAGQERR